MTDKSSHRSRVILAWVLGLIYTTLGVAYLKPDEFVRDADRAQRLVQNSVVAFIESLTVFPVWGYAFMVCGVGMMSTLAVGKRTHWKWVKYPLLLGLVVFSMFSTATWCTAIINNHTFMVNAVLSTGLSMVTLVMLSRFSNEDME